MRARWLAAAIAIAAFAGAAHADDKVLVLRSEGRADKQVRAKVEGAVLRLAQGTSRETTAGDITYVDAAAMVGCQPDEDACKAEVLGMLAVDEIVTISTVPKPGGVEVSVHRITKGGATRAASAVVTTDKADQLDPIAPLFGHGGPPSPLPPPVATTTPAVTGTTTPGEPLAEPPRPTVPPPSAVGEPAASPIVEDGPEPRDDDRPRSRKLPMYGMVGGGAMVLIGLVFWASAASVEDEIADAPMRTRDDLRKLQELEDEGDGYAAAGNLFVVGGLILGGVSTYYYLKGRKRSPSRSARLTPVVFGDGGGIAITWGGTP